MTLFDYRKKLSVSPSGYGHWLITYRCGNGCIYECVTDNSILIDSFFDSYDCTIAVCKLMARLARNGTKVRINF